jgi:flagella basal body P-ring formation protein FlgA
MTFLCLRNNRRSFQWLMILVVLVGSVVNAVSVTSAVAAERTITQNDVRHSIDQYLETAESRLQHVDYTFQPFAEIDAFTLPEGRLQVDVLPAVKGIAGSRHFTVIYRVDGRTVKSVTVRGKLLVQSDVVVAQRALKRGTLVGAGDVSLERLDVSRIREPIFSLDQAVGKLVVRNVRVGQAVEQKNIEMPPVVAKGGFVKIVARRGTMLLTAVGIALEDGKMGDVIRVQNNSSKKIVMAQVVGPDQVEVEF